MSKRGREFWLKLIREYRAKGGRETQVEFAARRGVKLGTFRFWLYRGCREDSVTKEAAPRLLPVRVIGPLASAPVRPSDDGAAVIVALVPSGVRVLLDPRLGAEFVADVLRRLG